MAHDMRQTPILVLAELFAGAMFIFGAANFGRRKFRTPLRINSLLKLSLIFQRLPSIFDQPNAKLARGITLDRAAQHRQSSVDRHICPCQ